MNQYSPIDDPSNQGIDPFSRFYPFSAPAQVGAEQRPPPLHHSAQRGSAVQPIPQVLEEGARQEVREHLAQNVVPGLIQPPPAQQHDAPPVPQPPPPVIQQQAQQQQPQQQYLPQQPQQQQAQQQQQQQAPPPPQPPPQPQQQQAPAGMYITPEQLEQRVLLAVRVLWDEFRKEIQELSEATNVELSALVYSICERSPETIQSMEDYQQLREWAITTKLAPATQAAEAAADTAPQATATPPAEDVAEEAADEVGEVEEDQAGE